MLIGQLQTNYTCIAIDLPGFGHSNKLRFSSIPEVATQINALIQQEGILKCTLFGHSMGGYIAAEYLNQFSEQLSGIGFIHSTVYEDSPTKKINRNKTISFIEKYGSREFFKVFVPSLVASQNLATLKDKLTTLVNSTSNQAILDSLSAMKNRNDNTSSLKSFKKPVLILKGQLDEHYPKWEIYQQASLPNITQLSILPSSGHLSMYESPDNCYNEILKFLDFSEDMIQINI